VWSFACLILNTRLSDRATIELSRPRTLQGKWPRAEYILARDVARESAFKRTARQRLNAERKRSHHEGARLSLSRRTKPLTWAAGLATVLEIPHEF
jgi:hypothetical protein